jgi:diguanylate cyclase (GGDEF)-like protein
MRDGNSTAAMPGRLAGLTLVGIIAWTSTSLIVISRHPHVGAELSSLWLNTGVFGLVAAVGLSEAQRRRERQQEARLAACLTEAQTDALTGLPNRRAFEHRLKDACQRAGGQAQPLWLLLVDVDHFKSVNDTHGHQAGDEILRGVAAAISDVVRQPERIARYGGEEFAVIAEGVDGEGAGTLAENIREAISTAACRFRGQSLRVTASVGAAQLRGAEAACELITRADETLYVAKSAGRDCCFVHDGTHCRRWPLPSHQPQASARCCLGTARVPAECHA